MTGYPGPNFSGDEPLDQTQGDPDFTEHACCTCGSHAHTCLECPVFLESVEHEAVVRELELDAGEEDVS